MKKFLKVLGIAALVAAVTPFKAEHDVETGERTYEALLWKFTSKPDHENGGTQKEISLFPNRFPTKAAAESELFADECVVPEMELVIEDAPVEEPSVEEPTVEEPVSPEEPPVLA